MIAESPEPADFAILVTQPGRPLPNETLHADRANAQQRAKRYPVPKSRLEFGLCGRKQCNTFCAALRSQLFEGEDVRRWKVADGLETKKFQKLAGRHIRNVSSPTTGSL